jgi:hypothetical protein
MNIYGDVESDEMNIGGAKIAQPAVQNDGAQAECGAS